MLTGHMFNWLLIESSNLKYFLDGMEKSMTQLISQPHSSLQEWLSASALQEEVMGRRGSQRWLECNISKAFSQCAIYTAQISQAFEENPKRQSSSQRHASQLWSGMES